MNTNERSFEIMGGPSRDTLFDACKYAYSEAVIPLEFSIAIGYTAPPSSGKALCMTRKVSNIRISSIEHEDGSGDKFNLHGYYNPGILTKASSEIQFKEFHAFYDVKQRRGLMTLLD